MKQRPKSSRVGIVAQDRKPTKSEVAAITEQGEAMSPATRLLEKRRMMFENQEAYKAKQREFAREEGTFRTKEKELREKDCQIQDSLIAFSSYLDVNQKQIKKATDNIEKLTNENRAKLEEMERKKEQLKILEQ